MFCIPHSVLCILHSVLVIGIWGLPCGYLRATIISRVVVELGGWKLECW